MSIKTRIPVTQGILNAVEETDEVYMNQLPTLHRWAIKYISYIGHKNLYERKAIVRTVQECRVDLPETAAHVNAVFMGNIGTDCAAFSTTSYYRESELTYMGSSMVFKWLDFDNPLRITPFPWSIRNNDIVFDCDLNNEQVTIDILLHVTDKDGIPLMHQGDEAVVEYGIKLELVNREKFKKFRKNTLRNADFAYSRELEAYLSMAIKNAKVRDEDHSVNHGESLSEMIYHPLSGKGTLNLL